MGVRSGGVRSGAQSPRPAPTLVLRRVAAALSARRRRRGERLFLRIPAHRADGARERDMKHFGNGFDRDDLKPRLHVVRDLGAGPWRCLSGSAPGGCRPAAPPGSFSFRPPIGSTFPRKVTSPVIATSRRTGMPVRTETIEVTMATPADGPSFGVRALGHVDMDVDRLEDRRLHAELRGVGAHIGRRRLDRFLHHVAKVAGHGLHLTFARHLDAFDGEQTHRRLRSRPGRSRCQPGPRVLGFRP